ncbi:MAG TPA: hypothetical protein VIN04_05680 [Myxococcota bacterium]
MSRAIGFVVIVVLCVGGALAYLWHARARTAPAAAVAADGELALSDGVLVYRVSAGGPHDGALAVAPLQDPGAARLVPGLRCERVHAAAGRGVCLVAERGFVTRYSAVVFDRRFQPIATLPLAGAPSRTQVSPDGRLAGVTVFVSGHSYAAGGFSTRTSIIDLDTGEWRVEDLEEFAVVRDGQPFSEVDFNFWGVTFTRDDRTFYATLGTGGETLLVRGDLEARRFEVVADDVECPSLSPDGRRIAYKHRVGGGLPGTVRWQPWVLDLESGARHALAETRNVDDQAQWLGDDQVLYALASAEARIGSDQWVVPADGSGEPRRLLAGAYSAAVHRDAPPPGS